jgi:hypothetical protein
MNLPGFHVFKFLVFFFSILLPLIPSTFTAAATSSSNCYDSDACRITFRNSHDKCDGSYCGRPEVDDGCGLCPWGTRSDGYICVDCEDPMNLYSWLFFFDLVFLFSVLDIALASRRRIVSVISVLESVLGVFSTLLVCKPMWSLEVYQCGVTRFRDFFPSTANPENQHCGGEVVYPLLTTPLFFFGMTALWCFVIRAVFIRVSVNRKMVLCPAAALVYALLYPFLYYALPYGFIIAYVYIVQVIIREGDKSITPLIIPGSLILSYGVFSVLIFFQVDYWLWLLLSWIIPSAINSVLWGIAVRNSEEQW